MPDARSVPDARCLYLLPIGRFKPVPGPNDFARPMLDARCPMPVHRDIRYRQGLPFALVL
jgi:hypothetical protein